MEFLPYERLCYDGVLEESVRGAALPVQEDCITPAGCALEQASQDNLGYPPHMQVSLGLVRRSLPASPFLEWGTFLTYGAACAYI